MDWIRCIIKEDKYSIMGNLYIVATQIGNLQDITFRAVEILNSVDFILCEDTRHTGNLLQHILIHDSKESKKEDSKKPRMISYYEENEALRIPETIELLKKDFNFALVSDAGTPTISDPGFKLVREVLKEGIRVESIPGPSSLISALVVSGLPTDKFAFYGFLPHKEGHRIKLLQDINLTLKIVKQTVIFFEAPHKLRRTLNDILSVFGDIEIVVCRELTKVYEEIRREKISKAIAHFQNKEPKGEFVILINLGEIKES